jgi:hypothetical protein
MLALPPGFCGSRATAAASHNQVDELPESRSFAAPISAQQGTYRSSARLVPGLKGGQ